MLSLWLKLVKKRMSEIRSTDTNGWLKSVTCACLKKKKKTVFLPILIYWFRFHLRIRPRALACRIDKCFSSPNRRRINLVVFLDAKNLYGQPFTFTTFITLSIKMMLITHARFGRICRSFLICCNLYLRF